MCLTAKVRIRGTKPTTSFVATALITAQHHIFHFYTGPTSPNTIPNMSKRRPREDAMILMAVKLYNASTVSTVRQSLLGAEFTPKESDDRARQMKVRRRVIKRNDASNGSTTTRARPSAIDAVSPASAVSSITAPSPVEFPPPKLTQIRRTTQGAQPYSHPMAPSINQKQLHNNQIGNGNVWRRGMTGRDHLFVPHAP